MMRSYTLHTKVEIGEDYVPAIIEVNYEPGIPASGASGPPENYDPGEPTDLEFISIIVDGKEVIETLSNSELLSVEAQIEEEVYAAARNDR